MSAFVRVCHWAREAHKAEGFSGVAVAERTRNWGSCDIFVRASQPIHSLKAPHVRGLEHPVTVVQAL